MQHFVKDFKSSLLSTEIALSKIGDNLVPLSQLLANIEF
jgi:hypothetical protein